MTHLTSHDARDDARELGALGYAQELFRTMGGFSNFAISFSIISILTGAVTLYEHGLAMGGPAEMAFGWPLVTLFTLAVALSMAELASSLPTSGAMYHWASRLGGKGWGWFTAWFNITGQLSALAAIDYGCALFVTPLLGLCRRHANGCSWSMPPSCCRTRSSTTSASAWSPGSTTSASPSTSSGVIAIVGALMLFAPKQPRRLLLRARSRPTPRAGPTGGRSSIGLLQAQWTFTGYDASASVSEETVDPRRRVPWGIVMAVVVSSVVGYLLLIALTLAIKDIAAVLDARDARRQRRPGGHRDSRSARSANAPAACFTRAGGDGDVVLRPVGRDVELADDLRVRARRRPAWLGAVETREREIPDAGARGLALGRWWRSSRRSAAARTRW